MTEQPAFRAPSPIERWFNRVFGFLAGLGIGLRHNYRLSVAGRKSGRIYATPVNLLVREGRTFLVAPRGETQWVRNVRAGGALSLKRGADEATYRASELAGEEKLVVLREYLRRYERTVQRYFAVTPESSDAAFADIAPRHPVFELRRDPAGMD
jgi:deazaflavin-dependent oxidoreductase (nitroreductase family)